MPKLLTVKHMFSAFRLTPLPRSGQWVAATALGLVIGLSAVVTPAIAEVDRAKRYADCMAMIDRFPRKAFDTADGWLLRGGGDPARHCAAAALLALGFAEDAAQRLETLAMTSVQDDGFRAAIYQQAGTAWTEAKNLDKAAAMQSAAITLAPDRLDYWVDRARTLALAQNYGLAVDDLNHVLDADAKQVEARILRGSAYRYLDAFDLAREDIDTVLTVEPKNPQALLESGILYRLAGDNNKARQAWVQALLQVEENSDLAAEVRRNIELLEFPAPDEAPSQPTAEGK